MGFHTRAIAPAAIAEGMPADAGGTRLGSHLPGVTTHARGTRAMAFNTLFYHPILVATPITIDEIMMAVTSAGAGSTTRIGIYTADVWWQPESLVIDAGTVDSSSTGDKIITLVPDLELPAGRYLLCFVIDVANVTFVNFRGGSRLAATDVPSNASPYARSFRVAFAYAALPTTPVKWTDTDDAGWGHEYCVRVRIADPGS